MSNWSAKSPYGSKITECYVLNGEGSKKETRHIVFDLGDSGLDYKVGDALGWELLHGFLIRFLFEDHS